jgi:hypothetical protein
VGRRRLNTRAKRRWTIPPAPNRGIDERLPWFDVIAEVPAPANLVLWMLLRDIGIWAAAHPRQRLRLFRGAVLRGGARSVPRHVRGDVRELARMLRRNSVGAGAGACRRLASTIAMTAPRTGMAFARAAALLEPDSARAACDVGLHSRAMGQLGVAESWFRRAVALARRAGDWSTHATALADLAETLEALRDEATAGRAFATVLSTCRRHSLSCETAARAHLGLIRLSLAQDSAADVHRRVRRVLVCYKPILHPRAATVRIELARMFLLHGRRDDAALALRFPMARGTPEERSVATRMFTQATGDPGAHANRA